MRLAELGRRRGDRPALSYRSRALYGACWLAGHTVIRYTPLSKRTIAFSQRIDTLAARAPVPRGVSVTPVSLDGFDAEWVRSRRATATPTEGTVLYFHGGGFFFCGLNTHRPGIAALSSASGLPVLSVAYRQLPEAPIAASVDDCLTAYRHLLDEGIPAERITFAGDSAGGFLTFATALRARDEGLPLPAGLAAASPLLDIDSTARMRHANVRRDTFVPGVRFPDLTALWRGEPGQYPPTVSPVDADLTGLPPSLIMAAETEVLLSDAETMASLLWEAGVQCKLQVWRGQVHAFPVLGAFSPETRAAVGQLATFLRESLKTD